MMQIYAFVSNIYIILLTLIALGLFVFFAKKATVNHTVSAIEGTAHSGPTPTPTVPAHRETLPHGSSQIRNGTTFIKAPSL